MIMIERLKIIAESASIVGANYNSQVMIEAKNVDGPRLLFMLKEKMGEVDFYDYIERMKKDD